MVVLRPQEAAQAAREERLRALPPPTDGLTGCEEPQPAIYGEFHAHLHSLRGPDRSVLEVGPAWGRAACSRVLGDDALAGKLRLYTVCDPAQEHLKALARSIDEGPHAGQLDKLRLVAGDFPRQAVAETLEDFVGGEHGYDAILAVDMALFHYSLDSTTDSTDNSGIQQAFGAFHRLLKPGGRLFLSLGIAHFMGWLKEGEKEVSSEPSGEDASEDETVKGGVRPSSEASGTLVAVLLIEWLCYRSGFRVVRLHCSPVNRWGAGWALPAEEGDGKGEEVLLVAERMETKRRG